MYLFPSLSDFLCPSPTGGFRFSYHGQNGFPLFRSCCPPPPRDLTPPFPSLVPNNSIGSTFLCPLFLPSLDRSGLPLPRLILEGLSSLQQVLCPFRDASFRRMPVGFSITRSCRLFCPCSFSIPLPDFPDLPLTVASSGQPHPRRAPSLSPLLF